MTGTRTMGQGGATLRVSGWDGASLVNPSLAGADPLGFNAGDTNLYRYVHNDPANSTDPSGMDDKDRQPLPGLVLPSDPNDLPPEWKPDPTHRDPNGQRFRDPSGNCLDFHKGRPGLPGWRGKDHWHYNGGKDHLPPGTQIQGSLPPSSALPPPSSICVTPVPVARPAIPNPNPSAPPPPPGGYPPNPAPPNAVPWYWSNPNNDGWQDVAFGGAIAVGVFGGWWLLGGAAAAGGGAGAAAEAGGAAEVGELIGAGSGALVP